MPALLKAKGLYTLFNSLSEVPDGALLTADNIIIDRNSVIESRRGFKKYGTETFGSASDRAKQLLAYKGRILFHYASSLVYDSDGSGDFATFSTSLSETETGLRIKGVEANSNLYVTSSDGIKKLSASSASQLDSIDLEDAGVVRALDIKTTLQPSDSGFFSAISKVAYRVLWGYKDNNDNLILGSPSNRSEIANTSTTGLANVTVNFPIPDAIDDVKFFYRIYRTSMFTATTLADLIDVTPDEEYYLAFEANVTTAELAAKEITVTDEQDEDILKIQVPLYTNPLSGEGNQQTNDQPPVAKDVALFKNSVFYANTRTKHFLDFTLLGIDGFAQTVSTITSIGTGNPTTVTTSASHNLSTGNYVYIFGSNSTPSIDGTWQVNVTGANTFTLPVNVTIAGSAGTIRFKSDLFISNGTSENRYVFRGQKQVSTITTVADIAGSLGGTYFLMNSAGNERKYFLWYNTGSTVQPSAADTIGRIPVRIDITPGDSDVQIASTTANFIQNPTLPLQYDFDASNVGTNITTVTREEAGYSSFLMDGLTPTGFSFSETTVGEGEFRSGSITAISTGVGTVTITAPDHGIVNGEIVTLSNTNSTPAVDGDFLITYVNENQFTISAMVTIAGTSGSFREKTNFVLLSQVTADPSTQITNTTNSLIRVINKQTAEQVYAYNSTTIQSIGGSITLQKKTILDETFYLGTSHSTISDNFQPDIPVIKRATNITSPSAGLVEFTVNSHGFVAGDSIIIFNSDTTPSLDGIHTVLSDSLSTNVFRISATISSGGIYASVFLASVSSSNEEKGNRLYFSKFQQPEAVPFLNYVDIGPKDKEIKRILALRDSLFVLKEDGIYRLTGEVAPNFSVSLLDNSVNILAPDAAVVLNNQIYMMSTQGVAAVSETGVGVISRPIENLINNITLDSFTSFPTATFAVSYESDRAYLLFTVTNMNDTVATQCFRFNTFTQSWVRWDLSKTCGIVNPATDKLYFGPTDQNFIEIERKDKTRKDHADREFDLSIQADGVDGTDIILSSVSGVEAGDVILQTQYVTIGQFNRLLKKLDSDMLVHYSDYFSTLEFLPGDNLTTKMANLVSKLNDDTGLSSLYVSSLSTDFATIQTEFNTIITTLNADSGAFFNNYQQSYGTFELEDIIQSVNTLDNIVTFRTAIPFMEGPVKHYQAFDTVVVWAPQHFGDPSILKQIREGTVLFESNTFTSALVGYATDLSSNFENTTFNLLGTGDWGNFTWNEINWGGEGSSVPIRTLIPGQKQRCRYIRCRYEHKNARESYAILGISYVVSPNSERAYR